MAKEKVQVRLIIGSGFANDKYPTHCLTVAGRSDSRRKRPASGRRKTITGSSKEPGKRKMPGETRYAFGKSKRPVIK
jgi:hypothetical protein